MKRPLSPREFVADARQGALAGFLFREALSHSFVDQLYKHQYGIVVIGLVHSP